MFASRKLTDTICLHSLMGDHCPCLVVLCLWSDVMAASGLCYETVWGCFVKGHPHKAIISTHFLLTPILTVTSLLCKSWQPIELLLVICNCVFRAVGQSWSPLISTVNEILVNCIVSNSNEKFHCCHSVVVLLFVSGQTPHQDVSCDSLVSWQF